MQSSFSGHGLTPWHSTTIIGVKRGGRTVIAGDGQVSMGNTVMKPNARKVRRIGKGGPEHGEVVAGFAGATADAFTLFERLEKKLEQYSGQLLRAAVEPCVPTTRAATREAMRAEYRRMSSPAISLTALRALDLVLAQSAPPILLSAGVSPPT